MADSQCSYNNPCEDDGKTKDSSNLPVILHCILLSKSIVPTFVGLWGTLINILEYNPVNQNNLNYTKT